MKVFAERTNRQRRERKYFNMSVMNETPNGEGGERRGGVGGGWVGEGDAHSCKRAGGTQEGCDCGAIIFKEFMFI